MLQDMKFICFILSRQSVDSLYLLAVICSHNRRLRYTSSGSSDFCSSSDEAASDFEDEEDNEDDEVKLDLLDADAG